MNEHFIAGFEKQALWSRVAGGALNLAKGVGSYIMKNPLKTIGTALTANELANGAKNGANMATKNHAGVVNGVQAAMRQAQF